MTFCFSTSTTIIIPTVEVKDRIAKRRGISATVRHGSQTGETPHVPPFILTHVFHKIHVGIHTIYHIAQNLFTDTHQSMYLCRSGSNMHMQIYLIHSFTLTHHTLTHTHIYITYTHSYLYTLQFPPGVSIDTSR